MKITGKKFTLSLAFLVLSLNAACHGFAPVTNQEYRKDNLAFTYLSNWKITEDTTTKEAVGDVRFISIEGPDDAVLTISRFPSDTDVTLESYVELLQSGMKQEAETMTGGVKVFKMDDGILSSVEARIAGATRHGLAREFDIKALSVLVPHRAETFSIENPTEKWFFVRQSSKEDWEKLKIGFQTIFDSLTFETAARSGGRNNSSQNQ